MATEHYALLVSCIALLVSIGIPAWQHRASKAREAQANRTLLLQNILEARSTVYIASSMLGEILRRYGAMMEDQQSEHLQSLLPKMRQHHDQIEELYGHWSDPSENPSVDELEEGFRVVDIILTDAKDMYAMIEKGLESYR